MFAGYRFRLIRPVLRLPDFVAPPGLTGTVLGQDGDVWARLDEPLPGAEAWDYELYWESLAEFQADTAALGRLPAFLQSCCANYL